MSDSSTRHIQTLEAEIARLQEELTVHRLAEEQLRLSEAQLVHAERLAHYGSWSHDFATRRSHWSDELFRIFGLEPQSILVTFETFLQFVHPDNREFFLKMLGNARANGGSFQYEYRMIRADGALRNIRSIGSVLLDPAGKPMRLAGAAQDITEILAAEHALRESEERFRQMASAINAVFWMRDPAINRIMYVSPAYERIWGRSLQSLYDEPRSFLDAMLPEDLKNSLPFFNESERPAETQYRIRQPGGAVRWIKDRAFPIRDASGAVYRITGLAEDITDHKETEQQILAYQDRLRELAAQLSTAEESERRQLAAKLHDDIGQTLAIAQIKLELLRKAHGAAHRDAGINEILALIENAIGATRQLTQDLSPPTLFELGFEPAIEQLAEQTRRQFNIPIQVDHPANSIPLDEDQRVLLYRAVRELVTNLVKHSRARSGKIAIAQRDGALSIEVIDDGVGFQDSQRSSGEQSCFGLFNIRERLKDHGGRLEIESAPGAGACIRLHLPLHGTSEVSR